VYLPSGVWIDYDTGKRYQGPATLQQFALPLGKTPLFVGGSGIVIEKRGAELVARIFRVNENTQTTFLYPDGLAKSSIKLNVTDWKHLRVTAGNGGIRQGEWKQNAFEFVITPGENYEVH
jgi:alpha-glucosidase (family GH31 glycosyl hydrolase)